MNKVNWRPAVLICWQYLVFQLYYYAAGRLSYAVILFLLSLLLLLPQFQSNVDMRETLMINTFSMTALAWILNQIVFQGTVNAFNSEKTILEKNMELEKKKMELREMSTKDSMTKPFKP